MFEAVCAPASFPAPPHAHVYCDRPPQPSRTQEGGGLCRLPELGGYPSAPKPPAVFSGMAAPQASP